MELCEYARLDGVGLRELIRAGEVSTAEVEVVARRALEKADAALNALTGPLFDPALAQEPGGRWRGCLLWSRTVVLSLGACRSRWAAAASVARSRVSTMT